METNCITAFEEYLKTNGYKGRTRILYLRASAQYLELLNLLDKRELYQNIVSILDSRTELSIPLKNTLKAALNQFFRMKTGIRIRDYEKGLIRGDAYDDLLSGYPEYLTDFRHTSRATAAKRVNIANNLVRALVKDPSVPDWYCIDARQVKDYILSRSNTLSVRSRNVEATSIRSFFKFLEYRGCRINPSIMVVPLSVTVTRDYGIPRLLSDEEILSTEQYYCNE